MSVPALAPATVAVSAPAAGTGTASPISDAPQVMGSGTWVVTSDETGGASLLLSAPAFAHDTVTGQKAAIRLDLTRTNGSAWAVYAANCTSTPTMGSEIVCTESPTLTRPAMSKRGIPS